MHINRKDINHNLTNDDVNWNQKSEGNAKAIVSLKVLNCFFWQKDGLLIDNEAIHENHASTKKSIKLEEEAILVVTKNVIAHLTKQNVG